MSSFGALWCLTLNTAQWTDKGLLQLQDELASYCVQKRLNLGERLEHMALDYLYVFV